MYISHAPQQEQAPRHAEPRDQRQSPLALSCAPCTAQHTSVDVCLSFSRALSLNRSNELIKISADSVSDMYAYICMHTYQCLYVPLYISSVRSNEPFMMTACTRTIYAITYACRECACLIRVLLHALLIIGLFCMCIGLFCMCIGLFCMCIGLFCMCMPYTCRIACVAWKVTNHS